MSVESPELLNEIYKDICDSCGMDAALEMYRLFKGQQISFPVHFFNPEMIHKKIVEEYDGTNIRQLAIRYDYSEKTIRRILKNEK